MIHDDHRGSMRRAATLLALLVLGLVLAWSVPPPSWARGIAGYGPLHTLLETVAIVIAALVFAVGWNAYSRELPGNAVLLACAFLGVALLDFSHALSFAGMPDYVTPSSPEKAINFWLAARLLATLALLAAVAMPWRPLSSARTRYLLLAAVLAATALAHWLFLFRPDLMPRTFVPAIGLTPFKIGSEYVLIALNLAAGLVLWLRMRTPQPFNAAALFVAVCTMALSEFFFTLYASVTDVYNLMGHLYKVVAYLFLYRAIFVETVELPYRELRATQDRLRSTLETIPDLLWLKNANGVYLDCNPTFERLFGSNRTGIVGRTDEDFVSKELAAHFREHDRKAMTSGKPSTNEEWLTFASDGYRGLFETVKTPMYDAAGKLVGVLGIARDITERKQAEAERHALGVQLRESQKMESMGTLAGGIAHDFNNVLGAIVGNVALAIDDLPAGHPALKSLEQISKASARARDLVQQILTFSRRQPQQLVTQPLRPLVEESLSLLRSTLPARVQLEAILSDAPLFVKADGTQIQQVLMNLCTNAWHALQDSSGSITVGLDEVWLDAAAARAAGALPPGRYAHLWVRDTGVGMNETTRARIFEPFFTTKAPDQGTGLGLSVVHGIVAAHQGVITVDTAVGEGSTFHLRFPAQQRPSGAPASAPGSAPQDTWRCGGEHVLYVDDDDVMLLVVERLLLRAGYGVTCCQTATSALAAVRAAPEAIDIVVSDYNMPGHSGLDLARDLAGIRADLPIVISSGYLSEELRLGAERVGVRHLLQKQNTLEELPRLLARVLSA